MPHGVWAHNSICQLTIIGSCFGQQVVAVHAFEASAAQESANPGDAAMQAQGDLLITTWTTSIKTLWLAMLPANYALVQTKAQIVERPGQRNYRLTPTETPASGPGTALAFADAENTTSAAVCKWRTPQAGKKHRGRTYIGPLGVQAFADGRLATAFVTAADAYRAAMNTAYFQKVVPNTSWTLTIYSRPYDHLEYGYVTGSNPNRTFYYPPDYDGDSTNVTSSALDPVLRTQRRRQIGVGS